MYFYVASTSLNGENKACLINLIQGNIIETTVIEVLKKLKSETIISYNDNVCHILQRWSNRGVSISNDLCSNQGKQTESWLYIPVLLLSLIKMAVVDVNITMLFLITITDYRVISDFNKGKDRRSFYLS